MTVTVTTPVTLAEIMPAVVTATMTAAMASSDDDDDVSKQANGKT